MRRFLSMMMHGAWTVLLLLILLLTLPILGIMQLTELILTTRRKEPLRKQQLSEEETGGKEA
jgi:hypothetical protein